MATYELNRTVHIEAPVDEVFDFLKNPANMWTALPKCRVSDVHLTPGGVGSSDHFFVRYWGVVVETGTHEVVEAVPDRKLAVRTHPYGTSNGPLWTWTLRPEGGGTRLDLDMVDEGPKAVLAVNRLFEKTMDGTYTRWLNAIKANVEALVGASR